MHPAASGRDHSTTTAAASGPGGCGGPCAGGSGAALTGASLAWSGLRRAASSPGNITSTPATTRASTETIVGRSRSLAGTLDQEGYRTGRGQSLIAATLAASRSASASPIAIMSSPSSSSSAAGAGPSTSKKRAPTPPLPRGSKPRGPSAVATGTSSHPSHPSNTSSAPPSSAAQQASRKLESLTSAIVAGSLASSRAAGQQPAAPARPAAPPRLPVRQLQTLRSADEEAGAGAGRQGRVRHAKIRTGRHAHHEGSRTKWREEITQRERKRYEGLWASNRGYLVQARQPQLQRQQQQQQQQQRDESQRDARADPAECVANVVVREIWRRSRLPADELAEIWDLVDRRRQGMLGRQEFVVGTWLVDQRLKGRKVPARVMESVWGSANGVILKKPRGRRE